MKEEEEEEQEREEEEEEEEKEGETRRAECLRGGGGKESCDDIYQYNKLLMIFVSVLCSTGNKPKNWSK